MGRKTYIDTEEDYVIKISNFKPSKTGNLFYSNLFFALARVYTPNLVVCFYLSLCFNSTQPSG